MTLPQSRFDAIVIGGGIIGTSAAYHLVKHGLHTLLVDRVDRGRATDAAAGIISAETYAGDCEAWAQFSLAAAQYYPVLIDALAETGEADVGYGVCGMLVVASGPEDLAAFATMHAAIARRQTLGQLPGAERLREVTLAEARQWLPELGEFDRILYSAAAARVDGRRLNATLLRAARNAGLQCQIGSVDSLIGEHRQLRAVEIDGQEIAAAQFVIAGGAWSEALARQLNVALPVAPQRGQLVHLSVSKLDTASWPIVEGFRGHYLVPWLDGRVTAGATRETGSGFAIEPTAAGVAEVLDEAVRAVPPLNRGALTEVRVGLRPASSDGYPIIGSLPGWANVFVATGHGAHGLHLGPYTGSVLADLMTARAEPLPMLSPARFSKS